MQIIKTAVIATALLLTGCANHYLISSELVAKSQAGKPPEIIESPLYKSERASIKTVAVRAPDSCSNRTAAEAGGTASAKGTILQTSCGVEMGEIEKSLAKKGFRIISWKVLAREMNEKGLSVTEIAASLGAEVIFQINSLEKSQKTMGKDARWERKYFESNADGVKIEEKSFDEAHREYFKNRFFSRFEKSLDPRRLAVTLDASAVLAKTGEAIWYYTWTYADPGAVDYRQELLVLCEKDVICTEITPENKNAKTNVSSSGDSEAISITEKAEDKEKKLYAELLAIVVDDMSKNFAKK